MCRKVIVAGHICLDITPVFRTKKIENLNEILTPGKLLQVGAAQVSTGGAVANTGLAMKLLGNDVTLMGMVGADAFGDLICSLLEKYDAQKGMLVKKGESSSYTIVIAPPGMDRMFLHDPGANDHFSAADIPQEALQETALFHFGYPPLMRSMYEKDGEELLRLMQRAQQAGAATSLDMAAIDPDSRSAEADWNRILQRVLPYVDFFVPSAEELCYMLNPHLFQEWKEKANGRDVTEVLTQDDLHRLSEQCLSYGAKAVMIKSGAAGIYYRSASAEVIRKISDRISLNPEAWAQKEGFEASFAPEIVLSGTGAGDTSIAAFLTAVLEGASFEEAVRLAAAEGACCVEAYDALGGLKTLPWLRDKIKQGWKKNQEQNT